jgi:glycosyltransferase involved in cell wall biosynthesis
VENAAWAGAEPRLSVLTPSYRDAPLPLLAALDRQAGAEGASIEVILLDDGGGDAADSQAKAAAVRALASPALFLQLERNEGRAKARNRLAGHARARHLLFLDSDLLPGGDAFLRTWLEAAKADQPVAYGGFDVAGTPLSRDTDLHRAMARRSDCLPASERRRDPAKYVFANNLLVRSDVFAAERFDERFVGWGWEDVEWGMRVARRWPILHIDNPVRNARLDTAEGLVRKYEQAAPNFARTVAGHPDQVASLPVLRAARVLQRAPLRRLWSPWLRRVALSGAAPMPARTLALRLYRASLYADAL